MNDTCVEPKSGDRLSLALPARHALCVFDRAAALERVDGDDAIFRELVETFCEMTPQSMFDLRIAIAERDADRIAWTTQSLKSSLEDMGGQRALAAAVRLEESARANDLDRAPRAFDFLECEIKRLTLEILQQVAG